jgi:hypothetical protein
MGNVKEHKDGNGHSVHKNCGCKRVIRGDHIRHIFCEDHGGISSEISGDEETVCELTHELEQMG